MILITDFGLGLKSVKVQGLKSYGGIYRKRLKAEIGKEVLGWNAIDAEKSIELKSVSSCFSLYPL